MNVTNTFQGIFHIFMTFFRILLMTFFSLSTFVALAGSAPKTFSNPILSGFHPDPSIVRVDDTYYLTNSTFEWHPALPIHKSKDLVNWERVGYGITKLSQLNLHNGLKDSLGIFAPTIRHHNGKFYIITTCVGCGGNFIITAERAEGPWSDPIWIKGAIGIDPSLYWEDGKAYYLGAGLLKHDKTEKNSQSWPGKNGIWMQEINTQTGELLGDAKQLTFGHASNARWAEGPHLYKIGGEYLLLIGEGGTNEYHAVTVFNSASIWGPYIPNHANPVLTHRHLGNTYPITQTGHADLVQTQDGDWWSVMLAKRPIDGHSILARETFLTPVKMVQNESGVTPIYNPGIGLVKLEQERPALPWSPIEQRKIKDDFNSGKIGGEWNTLRSPTSDWFEQSHGQLELMLRPQIIEGLNDPSFLARRVEHHQFSAATKMQFSSSKDNEKAGLVLYRRSTNHYQLLKREDRIILVKTSKYGPKGSLKSQQVASVLYPAKDVVLHISVNNNVAQFSYGPSLNNLTPIGGKQDLTILSDEYTQRFNGTYIGMYATSGEQTSTHRAKFDWFDYRPIDAKK